MPPHYYRGLGAGRHDLCSEELLTRGACLYLGRLQGTRIEEFEAEHNSKHYQYCFYSNRVCGIYIYQQMSINHYAENCRNFLHCYFFSDFYDDEHVYISHDGYFRFDNKAALQECVPFCNNEILPEPADSDCSFALLVLSFYNPIIGYIMFILITMGLTSYITNFYVYSKIEKIHDPARGRG